MEKRRCFELSSCTGGEMERFSGASDGSFMAGMEALEGRERTLEAEVFRWS